MLGQLTSRLIQSEVNNYNKNILIEGTLLSTDLGDIKRSALVNDKASDLDSFKNKLLSVKFDSNVGVEEMKESLLNAVKKNSINESNEKLPIHNEIKDYRKKYINACDNDNSLLKSEIISRLKNRERLKKIIEGE